MQDEETAAGKKAVAGGRRTAGEDIQQDVFARQEDLFTMAPPEQNP